MWRSAKVRVAAGRRPDDRCCGGRAAVAEKERSAQDLVNRLGKGLERRAAERSCSAASSSGARTGPRPVPAHPLARGRLRPRGGGTPVADGGAGPGRQPDPRTAALVALLAAIDRAHKVVDRDGLPAGQVRKRAKEIAEGEWAAKAVKDAIAGVHGAASPRRRGATTAAAASGS